MDLKERVKDLCEKNGTSMNQVEMELGFGKGYLSKLGKSTPNTKKIQLIANHFGVSLDYLLSGAKVQVEKSPELTARDEKDITKTLNKVMEQFENNENGPLYYDGEEIDETSRNLIRNAFEYVIRETKKENKVKYNPNKNKDKK